MHKIDLGPEALKPDASTRGQTYNSPLECLGATPLTHLPRITQKYALQAKLLVKLEGFNPLLSIKDRAAFAVITEAERSGKIQAGTTTLIEASAGSFAISLASAAAAKGYALTLVMPESVSIEKRKILRLMNAELILTPAERGMKGAIDRAHEITQKREHIFAVEQFKNLAITQMHRETTAEEIWIDTQGQLDIFIAGVGTGATLTGCAQFLKQKNPDLRAYAVEPAESAVLSGEEAAPHKIKGIGAGFMPELYQQDLIDGIVKVSSQEAIDMAREVAALEGLACGLSSGANIAAAIKVAQVPDFKGKTIVTIASSAAERYLSSELFEGLSIT